MFLKTYNFFKCSFPSNAKNIVVFKISEARLYCKIVENEEPKITKSLAKDCSLRDKAKVLYKLFDIRLLHAMDIISRYKCYQTTPVQIITKNFELVKREGIPTKTIMRYPEVIGQNNLELKLELLKKLPCDVHKTYPLLNVTLNVADKFFNQESLARIQFYSRLFKLSIPEMCDVIAKRQFLLKSNIETIEKKCKLLLDYGISMENIHSDFWALRYSTKMIQQHLGNAKKQEVETMKTWMVRAQPDIFNHYIQRRQDNKTVLGENSIAEYLAKKLNCSVQESQTLLSKHPAILNKSMKSIEKLIDFLISQGFTTEHILRCSKILLHSFETTQHRLGELNNQGIKIDSLHILTKSQKQYMVYYNNGLTKRHRNKLKKVSN